MAAVLSMYLVSWSLACLVALAILVRDRETIALCQGRYWRFLLRP